MPSGSETPMEHDGYVKRDCTARRDQASTGAMRSMLTQTGVSSRSIPVSQCSAFPESVRSLTGPVWSRLLNTNSTFEPSGSDRLRLPLGIGVGIGWTANRGHWNQPSTSSTALMEPAALKRLRSPTWAPDARPTTTRLGKAIPGLTLRSEAFGFDLTSAG